jgi:hypothetical protein
MCFSAEASFAASGVLAASSVAIARVPKEKASIPLSLFPAIFATHQFIEGILWLNHDGVLPDSYKAVAVYAYAVIAYVLWPVFVPFAVYLSEPRGRRRAIMLVCQVLGLGVGLWLLVSNVAAALDVSVDCCSLSYSVNAPPMLIVPYLIAVSVPFLACSRRGMVLFGLALAASCAAAAVLASMATFPSVWCFFAAILSGGLYLHFRVAARRNAARQGRSAHTGAVAGQVGGV